MPDIPAASRRWPKRLLIGSLAVAFALGAGYAALLFGLPPERVAALLAEQVSARTGREFALRGELSYRLLPRIAVVARKLELGNAPWGSRKEMLRVERAAIELDLWPLLQGRVHVGSVELDGVDLLLETGVDGGNWVMAAAGKGAASAPAGGEPALAAPGFDVLRLRDVVVTYRDHAEAHTVSLERFDLDREGAGSRVDAGWAVRGQRWLASGRIAAIEALLANRAEWPFEMALTSEGARVALRGRVLPGSTPRGARLDVDARIERAAALAPWLPAAAGAPMPIEVKSVFAVAAGTVGADPLSITIAGQTLAGRARATEGTPWQFDASLKANSFDLARASRGRDTVAGRAPAAGPAGGRAELFGDEALPGVPFGALPNARARVTLRFEQLLLPATPPLSAVTVGLDLRPGRLSLEPLAFDVAGGTVRAGARLDVQRNAPPRLALQIDAAGLSAEALARAAGHGEKVGGGRVDLKASLATSGNTPRELAAGASGKLLLTANDMTLADGTLPIGSNLLPRLLQSPDPGRRSAPATQVECAVANLTLKDGLALVDRSIALETGEVALSASGRIDLRDQTLELAMRPVPRRALGVNPAPLASLVVAKGPLLDPKLSLDAKGAANLALTLGAAAASGGWSLLGRGLSEAAADPHPCVFAATGVAPKPAARTGAPPAKPDPAAPSGKQEDVRRLLRGLFK